jgi:hypothetical protein
MDVNEMTNKITSGDIPAIAMGIGGVAAVLLSLKPKDKFLKGFLAVLGLVLIGGAVWWHFHHTH